MRVYILEIDKCESIFIFDSREYGLLLIKINIYNIFLIFIFEIICVFYFILGKCLFFINMLFI